MLLLIELTFIIERHTMRVKDTGCGTISVALVRHGFIPTSPVVPHTAIEIKTLELYRRLSSRCPNVGVQPFVRVICDLHQVSKLFYSVDAFVSK